MNGTHKIVGYADYLALLKQRDSKVKATSEVLDAKGKKLGLRISRENTKYFRMRRYQNTREKIKDLHERY